MATAPAANPCRRQLRLAAAALLAVLLVAAPGCPPASACASALPRRHVGASALNYMPHVGFQDFVRRIKAKYKVLCNAKAFAFNITEEHSLIATARLLPRHALHRRDSHAIICTALQHDIDAALTRTPVGHQRAEAPLLVVHAAGGPARQGALPGQAEALSCAEGERR